MIKERHLLSRFGFGMNLKVQLDSKTKDYPTRLSVLLDKQRNVAITPEPDWVQEPIIDRKHTRSMSMEEKNKFFLARRSQWQDLKAWWYQEMVESDSPITEHMTLFWHNHFTSSLTKVRPPTLMYRQNALLRRHALGNFRELLHRIAKDPAMIIYLDNETNRIRQ